MLTFTGASDDLLSVSDHNSSDELHNTSGRFTILVYEPDGVQHGALWIEFEYGGGHENIGTWAATVYPYDQDIKVPWRTSVSFDGYKTSVHIHDTVDAKWEYRDTE